MMAEHGIYEKDVLEFEEQREAARPRGGAGAGEGVAAAEFVAGQQNPRPDSGEGSLRSSD